MIFLGKNTPWSSFLWSALTMLGMIMIILGISRIQLHKEVLESDARFLASIFEKNLEDIYMQSLDSDLLNQDAELNLSNIWEIVPLLNQSALVSLNIPHIQGIQAYDQNHRVLDLSTAINRSHPTGKDFVDAHSQGWSSRVISPTSLALLVPVTHDEELHFIEFSLLREPFENSWSEIDNTLVKQGLILALAMMAILWVIFRLMIRKISSKEKLLIEKTEVLQKTNEELSRAYKTTSLGAMTGHLMHGLKGQLTNLQNLVTEDKNIQEQIRKIQQLVQQSLGSIKETDHGEISYNLTVGQLLEIAQKKFTQLARETNFKIVHSDCLNESINNLQANLALAILTNLFQNSADARPGVSITLTCQKNGSFLELDVSDDGGGIPAEIITKPFEPVVSKKKGGSGIGLALSRQLAESMGGNLKILHSNSEGTTFRLSIPYLLSF